MRNRLVLEGRLYSALEALLYNDHLLLEFDVGERTVCGRLAMYLQGLFPTHDVDVEYNRHETDPKRLQGLEECETSDGRVFPDIVVHRRGVDDRNLLVIEVKKSTNATSRECDRAKLRGFVEDFEYAFAVLVDLPVAERTGEAPECEWFSFEE